MPFFWYSLIKMNYTILLDSDTNVQVAEREEKFKFIRAILEFLNIDLSFWDSDKLEITTDLRIKLREISLQFDIDIVERADGEAHIYFEQKLIGEWRKPQYVLKRDISKRDPRKQLYLEMQVNFSSIFEDT